MKKHLLHIKAELQEHLPYTIFSATAGLALLGIITVLLGEGGLRQASHELFHVFHPIHLLFSAAATTAMFWRHEKRFLKAVIIGFLGSVGICGISDIIFPFLGGLFLGIRMEMHICIVAHPSLVLPFVLVGIFAGFLTATAMEEKSTIFSHAGHVFISSMASILYLVAFGLSEWIHAIGAVLVIIILAVMVPCCTSDIVFPLLFTQTKPGLMEQSEHKSAG